MHPIRIRLTSAQHWLAWKPHWLAGKPRSLSAAIVLMALLLVVSAGYTFWFVYDLTAGLPTKTQIRALGEMVQATSILDARDAPAFIIFKEQRIEVPFDRISPTLIKAVVSVEDQRFFDHSGVDLIRVAAAVVRNLHEGRRAEGGSTITQQLARQMFLSRDKTYRRKMKEVILAAHIEREYSKTDILELYLNKVYFGDGLYGVEAASRGYFAKHASEVTVDEAALLAGLIQSPSSYAPTVNLDRALARRNVVLQAMVSAGAIDRAAYEQARRAKVTLTNGLEFKENFGLYFKELVRRELVERFGAPRVAVGGMRVFTTLDPALQQAAEEAVAAGLGAIERRRGYKPGPAPLQGALVAMDPQTGAVRAMVGGRDFSQSPFNRATQAKRQSGSAFKPFVYAAALEAGYSPASVIGNLNAPTAIPGGLWVPEDEHSGAGSMTMRSALRMSSNRAAVQMLNTIGIPKAVSYAEKLNLGTPPGVPSLALGASDVTLLALTRAYGSFADEGILRTPVLIRRVEDSDGKVLYQDPGHSQRAVSEATAFLMSSMLADVINAGTAYKARQSGFSLPAAGKTGTTNDYVDAWFVGFTPHLVTGVWVGFDQPRTIVPNGYAAELAVPIWGGFMKTATKGDKPDWFTKPADVVAVNVCRVSGKLPNFGCSNVQAVDEAGYLVTKSQVYTDYFVKGSQPTTICPLHPGGILADGSTFTIPSSVPTTGVAAPTPPARPVTGGTVDKPAEKEKDNEKAKEKEKDKKKGFWSRLFGRGKDKDKKPGGGGY
jgi:1A family penicillin-binding protein